MRCLLCFFCPFLLLTAAAVRAEQGPVRIGVLSPLTGPGSRTGQWVVDGAKAAAAELNTEIELFVEDDRCDGKGAVSAYTSLVKLRGVKVILGPLCNAAAVPLLPLAKRDNVILLTTGLANRAVRQGGQSVFTQLPSVEASVNAVLDYAAATLGRRTFAMVSVEDEYGEEGAKAAAAHLGRRSLTAALALTYEKGTTDFNTFAARIKHTGADAVLMIGYGPEYAAFLRQSHAGGLRQPFLTIATFQVPETAATGLGPPGSIYYSYPGTFRSPQYDDFCAKYWKDDAPLPMYVAAGYDGVRLLAKAVRNCPAADAACISVGLRQASGYAGVIGEVRFDNDGNNEQPGALEIRTLVNGRFSPASPKQ